MIYCPKCGTANRRGSRFCNECGELLPAQTTLRCPMCGAMNPVGNAYCDRCNARIIPLGSQSTEEQEPTPLKGLSLPTIPLREQWEQQPSQEVQPAGEEDWLAQLRGLAEQETPQVSEAETTEPPARPRGWAAEEPTPGIGAGGMEDWLAQLRGSTGPESPAAGGETEEAADWLSQLRTAATEEARAPEGPPAIPEPAEIPDWLRGLGPVEAAPTRREERAEAPKAPVIPEVPFEETAPVKPPPAPAEMPDWLREIARPTAAPAGIEFEPETPAKPAPAPAEMPDWLSEIAAPAAPPPTADITPEEALRPTPTRLEIPDWLSEIAAPETAPHPVSTAPEEALRPTPTPGPVEIPDWLSEIAAPETAPPEPAAPAPEEAEIPNWLRELTQAESIAPTPATSAVFVETTPTTPAPVPSEIPDWLREMAPPLTEAAPSAPPLEVPPTAVSEMPAWLADLEPVPSPMPSTPVFEGIPQVSTAALGAETIAAEGLVRAEIPEWLQAMRPREEAGAPTVEEDTFETAGPLGGLRGLLTPIAEIPHTRERAPSAKITAASVARAQLLQSLVTRPAEAPPVKAYMRGISLGEQILHMLVRLLLAFAIAGALLIPHIPGLDIQIPRLTLPAGSAAVQGMHTAVEGIGPDSPVLVAIEYGPTEADELDLVAKPILAHLLARQARILVASTRPEGEAMAARILAEGQYIPVGYRPGGSTGAAQLLADTEIKAGARPALILVLAAQPAPLRGWVEQVRAKYGTGAPPIVAGVSAALEPVANPYLDSNAGQLRGMVSGLSGAATYEMLQSVQGEASERLNVLAVGHAAVVVLIISGLIIYVLAGPRRRGRQ